MKTNVVILAKSILVFTKTRPTTIFNAKCKLKIKFKKKSKKIIL